jgi:hypothetical protein
MKQTFHLNLQFFFYDRYFVYTPSNQSTEDYYDATSHYSEFR